jgi:colanic acid biosynthesis glycosyl transferase WcaI
VTAPLSGLSVTVVGIYYAPDTTGIAPYTTDMCRTLAAAGADVHAVVGVPHYPQWKVAPGYKWRPLTRSTEDGVRVSRVRHFVPHRHDVLRRVLYEATFLAGTAAVRAGRPDVVLGVTPTLAGAATARLLASRHRAPLGLIVQDLVGAAATQSGIRGGGLLAGKVVAAEAAVLRSADRVGIISTAFAAPLTAMGVPAERIQPMPNYARLQHTDLCAADARQQLGWPMDHKIVLHTGNMGLKQGLSNVVDAARLAADHGRDDLLFILLGDGSDRLAVQRAAAGLTNVVFLDPLPDERYPLALAAADVLLLNERASVVDMCLPSKLTSYLASGRPVVAATGAGGGAAQLVLDAGAGVVVPPERPEKMLSNILWLLDDPSRAAALGDSGRRYAHERLSKENATARTVDLVLSLAAAGGRPHRVDRLAHAS